MQIALAPDWAIPMTVKSLSFSPALLLVAAACAPTQPSSPAASPHAVPSASPTPAATEQGNTHAAGQHSAGQQQHSAGQQSGDYLLPEASEGRSQSPINIVTSRAVPAKHEVRFHYQTSKEHVANLGHTIKVAYDAGSSLEFDGTSYDLQQFHFHTPSEHLLDGVTYPMEMHLVHTEHGHPERFLVIGVLFKEGNPNGLLDTLLGDVPRKAGETVDADAELDASSIFKPGEGYFHYAGSLTTPPYTEAVTWLVLDQVHDASAEQVEALNRIEGNNARHIQDQRARLIDHGH